MISGMRGDSSRIHMYKQQNFWKKYTDIFGAQSSFGRGYECGSNVSVGGPWTTDEDKMGREN